MGARVARQEAAMDALDNATEGSWDKDFCSRVASIVLRVADRYEQEAAEEQEDEEEIAPVYPIVRGAEEEVAPIASDHYVVPNPFNNRLVAIEQGYCGAITDSGEGSTWCLQTKGHKGPHKLA